MPNQINSFQLTTSGVSSQSRLVDKTKPPSATRTITTFAASVNGTATYTLYYSYQQENSPDAITRWHALSSMNGVNTNVDDQFNRIVTALKLTQSSGDGQVTLDVIVENQS